MKISALLAVTAASLAFATPSLAQTTIPDENPEFQGRSPFRNITNSANGGESGSRNQIVYRSDFFGTGSQTITGFSLRAANGPMPFLGNQVNFEDVTIGLSTTSRTDLAGGNMLSTNFADNLGADATTVYSGALSLMTAASGDSRPFDFTVTFQNGFAYDPSMGNLLLDVLVPVGTSVTSNGIFGSFTFGIDGGVGDGAASLTSIQNGAATVGIYGESATTIQFAFGDGGPGSAIPEPATWGMMILGFGLIGGAMRSRKMNTVTVGA